MAKNSAGTPDHSSQHEKMDHGLYGPLYSEPEGAGNLGPVSVGEPKGGKNPPDPLGLRRGGKKGK